MITLDLHLWMLPPAAWFAVAAYCALIDELDLDALKLFGLVGGIPVASMLLTRFLP